jgi:hypothetical protein
MMRPSAACTACRNSLISLQLLALLADFQQHGLDGFQTAETAFHG